MPSCPRATENILSLSGTRQIVGHAWPHERSRRENREPAAEISRGWQRAKRSGFCCDSVSELVFPDFGSQSARPFPKAAATESLGAAK